jgi:imidazolonepropionase-like amidohydrolase
MSSISAIRCIRFGGMLLRALAHRHYGVVGACRRMAAASILLGAFALSLSGCVSATAITSPMSASEAARGAMSPATTLAVAAPAGDFVIRNARIFDGDRVLSRGDVWVENGLIRAVGPDLATPASVPAFDATGKTLLPGLIDAHVHTMGSPDFLRSALALGVTTELDMGASASFAYQVEKEQAAGRDLDLADLRSSGTQPTAPDGHGTEYGHPVPTLSTPAEAQAFVDARIAESADFIGEIIYDDGSEYGLQIPTLDQPTLRAVIEAAHRRGKLAVVHVLALDAAKEALAAGADGLVHLFGDRPADSEFVALASRSHAFVIPTLSLFASMAGTPAGPALARDPNYEPYLTPDAIADMNTALPPMPCHLEYAKDAVRQLAAAGVPILAGTDAHNPGTAHGASLHGELQLLIDAGRTPLEALESATSVNARCFRLDDRGRIAPGLRADLVLVDGDPTTRITDVGRIIAVWKRGVPFDREAYRATLEARKHAEALARCAPAPAGSETGAISDFENGTTTSTFGLGWRASAGQLLGGHKPEAKIAVVDSGAAGSTKALEITGEIPAREFGWSGAMFFPGATPMAPVNLSSWKSIRFWCRGDGRRYQVLMYSRRKGVMPAAQSVVAGPAWTEVALPIAAFGTDASDLQALMIGTLGAPGRFRLEIDDVRLGGEIASGSAMR